MFIRTVFWYGLYQLQLYQTKSLLMAYFALTAHNHN